MTPTECHLPSSALTDGQVEALQALGSAVGLLCARDPMLDINSFQAMTSLMLRGIRTIRMHPAVQALMAGDFDGDMLLALLVSSDAARQLATRQPQVFRASSTSSVMCSCSSCHSVVLTIIVVICDVHRHLDGAIFIDLTIGVHHLRSCPLS